MSSGLRFAGDLSPVWGVLLAVLVGAMVGWLYRRETYGLARPYSYLLPGLRALAVGLLILILTGPVWHRRQVVGTLGRVTFALDDSQSMSINDSTAGDSQPNRLERAIRLLLGDSYRPGWIETLRQTHEVEIVRFAEQDVTSVWSSRAEVTPPKTLPLMASGKRTDLAAPLKYVLPPQAVDVSPAESAPRDSGDSAWDANLPTRQAVVLVSDGRDNLGDSAVDVASQLGLAGIVVHTLAMGSTDEPPDVGILQVDHPDNVAADGKLAGQIILKQIGLDDSPIRVRIESDGETVWEKQFENGASIGPAISFQLDVESLLQRRQGAQLRGVRRGSIILDLKATVDPVEGEALSLNNEFAFRVGASTRNRQLLILDGSSRWEIRYLRNLFQRDPAWDVTSMLFGPGTDMPQVVRGAEPGQFPDSEQAWAKYDAVILGEVPPQQLGPNDAYRLREFVSRGGGLIAIDGRYDRLRSLAKGAIADLIPVQYIEGQPRPRVRVIRPTYLGLEQSVMNLTGEASELSELWQLLPAPRTAARVRALEGAEVWADAVGVDGREMPWLVTRLFGAGRVFYVSTDESWRWRYKVADRFHAKFWNQLLAAAIQPPYSAQDEFVSIATDRIEYAIGEMPRIRVRLQNPQGDPVGDATVDALFVKDNHVVATIPLISEDPLRGTYEGSAASLPAGAYTVRARASGFDESSFVASTPLWIGRDDRAEWSRVSLDVATMTSIAKNSGGEYFHESRADELLESLQPLSQGTVVESDILVWQSFYWFWAVIVVLAIEWWLRKQVGLV